MKRRLIGLLLLFITLALGSACSRTPASIFSLTVTASVDERTKEPGEPVKLFPAGTTQFYAVARVLHPRKGTKVKCVWYYENREVDQSEITFDVTGDRHVAFNLVSTPGKVFPPGPYRAEVWLDGQKTHDANFEVK